MPPAHLGARTFRITPARTTHQPPLLLFKEREREALLPLPAQPFTLCEIKPVKAHTDCYVVINGSFYPVPCRHVDQTLDAHVGEGASICSTGRSWWPLTHAARKQAPGTPAWNTIPPIKQPISNAPPHAVVRWWMPWPCYQRCGRVLHGSAGGARIMPHRLLPQLRQRHPFPLVRQSRER